MIHNPDTSIQDMLDISDVDNDPENPMGGVTKAIVLTSRIVSIPVAMVAKFGQNIAKKFAALGEKIKDEAIQYWTIRKQITDTVATGDIKALWSIDAESAATDENPVGGFQKFLAFSNKLYYSIPTLLVGVGKGIKDFFSGMVEKTKSNKTKFDEVMEKLKENASKGDLSAIWKEDAEFESGDPLGSIWKVGTVIGKLFNSAVAIFEKLAGPIQSLVDKVKEKVQPLIDTANAVGDWWDEKVSSKVDSAKEWVGDKFGGAYESAQAYITGGSSFINQRNTSISNEDSLVLHSEKKVVDLQLLQ